MSTYAFIQPPPLCLWLDLEVERQTLDIDEQSFLRGVVGIAMCLFGFFDVSRICQRWWVCNGLL
jgi:hypothetical protein